MEALRKTFHENQFISKTFELLLSKIIQCNNVKNNMYMS